MDPAEFDVNESPFGPVISRYTREQAIADGILVDVTGTAREAGITFPTCVTTAVWSQIVRPPEIARKHGESASGRLWDVLFMLVLAIRAVKTKAKARGTNMTDDTVYYSMIATDADGRKQTHQLWARVTGEGENGAPVITVMLRGED